MNIPKEKSVVVTDVTEATGFLPMAYRILDLINARRLLALFQEEVDDTKAAIFWEFAPTLTLGNKNEQWKVTGELHSIVYDEEYEDTVAEYDFVIENGPEYRIWTVRYEIVDGKIVQCTYPDECRIGKSEYHLRRRERDL